MLGEAIDTLCPQEGSVIDHFSGSITTELPTRRTGRKCVSIEKKEDYFNEVLRRLRQYVPPFVKKGH